VHFEAGAKADTIEGGSVFSDARVVTLRLGSHERLRYVIAFAPPG
jgi:hypothetical protein